MKLEVLLSVINLNVKNLDKMNITSDCTVINQSKKEEFKKYKNFSIYSYDELGLAKSRNRGLDHVTNDIILLCDDDIVYNNDYEKVILDAFREYDADLIVFNMEYPSRKKRIIKKNKRLHLYNSLNYGSCNIAFRKSRIENIRFNELFGANGKYSGGEDSLFISECFKNKLKVYSNKEYIGKVLGTKSTWFHGYNEKFFFDKGALYTAINKRFRHILILQHLLRHRKEWKEIKFFKVYKAMLNGSRDYLRYKENI